jgi:hypothetical protein
MPSAGSFIDDIIEIFECFEDEEHQLVKITKVLKNRDLANILGPH